MRQVLCNAHARRKFFEARTVQPEPAHRALAYIGRLYGAERTAQELADRTSQSAERAWRDRHVRRRELRQSQSRPVLAEFHAWLQEAQWQVLPKSPVGREIGYVLPQWEGLTRYCEDGALAIGRENYLFVGSDNGGKAAAILYSVLASAKSNQVEPFAYVRDLLVQFSGARPTDLSGLLPDAWLRLHPESRRRWSR